jgi:outer membrane lipoprotein-sorting protein
MNRSFRVWFFAALSLPILLSGCSLFPTIRKLPMPKAPVITQTATPEELATRLNTRWEALNTLTATVEIQASVYKSKEGTAKDYPTLHGFILMRKPAMLRVVGMYLGVRAFDMASDGSESTISIPAEKKVIKRSNSLKRKSANALENLRPQFFLDALVVRGLDPDDLYEVTSDSSTQEDSARKHLYSIPQYVLSISRRKPGSQQLLPVRKIFFHREDLQPYEQDIYDSDGIMETQVLYDNYQNFDTAIYPSSIVIKRPLEELEISLTVDKINENQTLKDDQFVVTPPEGSVIQNLE